MGTVKELLPYLLSFVGVILGIVVGDRRKRGDQRIGERQAAAAEGLSVAGLAAQVSGLAKDIGALEKQVRDLTTENEAMRQRLDAAQDRLSAAIEYISDLIAWVEKGAHAPAPAPRLIIARDILLPAAWLHSTDEQPS